MKPFRKRTFGRPLEVSSPGRLGALLDSGVIDEMVVRTALNKGEVLITLSAGTSWRELGDDIREALSDALLARRRMAI